MAMNIELQATCSALGYLEDDGKYVKEPYCIETVKDLIRFLKREEDCEIRRQLGAAQIVSKDLIPIIKEYNDDKLLLDIVVRLLVNLTQPAILCFHNQIPEEKSMYNYYMEVQDYLCLYKEAFADEFLFAVLAKKLGALLQLDWENRQEEDRLLIERILIVVRNILHVPPHPSDSKRTDDDASVHDQVLWSMHKSGMEDLLLYVASSDDERQYCMHILEIISLMYREQTANQLAHAGAMRLLTEKQKDEQELIRIREQELQQKKQNIMKFSTRHSRFGGTYVVSNMKSITSNNLIYHRSLGDVNKISFDQGKRPKKKAKNRQPILTSESSRRSTLSIRLFLKEFCIQFLENCYNPLMRAVKDNLLHNNTQQNDETYYLWAMRFFMEFSRLHQFKVDIISETMSIPTFHYVMMQMTRYHDMITTEKKEAVVWSKRLHLALRAYKELCLTLTAMDSSTDDNLKESVKVLKSNLFYMPEYRDIFLTLLKTFNQSRNSRGYLKDLVETTHTFLRMLEKYIGINKHVVVQRKVKKKSKKRKPKKAAGRVEVQQPQFSQEELEEMWDAVADDLSAMLQGRTEIPTDVTPFDATSEADMEQQKMQAIVRIQDCLRNKEPGMSVALLRAGREVWPENDVFGTAEISPENEFMCLREFFMTNINRPDTGVEDGLPGEGEEVVNEDVEEEEEDEEEMHVQSNIEQEFDFIEFVTKFSNSAVLKPYILLLSEFDKNTIQTNHFIVKMLHRVAVDRKMVPLLFQLSLFRIFHKVLNGAAKAYKELATFAQYVLRKFFEIAETNKKVFVEVLFWKNVREAIELTDGYGSYKNESGRVKQLWNEEQDAELTHLYDEFRDNIEDEKDVVDIILTHLIDQQKTRRQVIAALVRLELISSAKELRKKKSGAGSRVRGWQEEQEVELRELFDKFRESEDPLGSIMSNMTDKRSKNKVAEKLMELGLVSDRKELYKKRKRGGPRNKKGGDDDDGDIIEDDDSSDDQDKDDGNRKETFVEPPSGNESDDARSSSGSNSDNDASDNDDGNESSNNPAGRPLRKVLDAGLEGQVAWLRESLESAAEDRSKGVCEPVPIVPISEENYDALENKFFKSLMKHVGIRPPANEQESFWRLPETINAVSLLERIKWLDRNYQGPSRQVQSKLKSSDRFSVLKNLAKKKRAEMDKKEEARKKKYVSPDKTSKKENTKPQKKRVKYTAETVANSISELPSPSHSSDSDSDNSGVNHQSEESQLQTSVTPTRRVEQRVGLSNTSPNETEASQTTRLSSGGLNAKNDKHDIGKKKRIKMKTLSSDSESDDERLMIDDDYDASKVNNNKRVRLPTSDDSQDETVSPPSHPTKRSRLVSEEASDSQCDKVPAALPEDFTLVIEGAPESIPVQSFPATMLSQELDSSDSDIDDHMPLKRVIRRRTIESDSD